MEEEEDFLIGDTILLDCNDIKVTKGKWFVLFYQKSLFKTITISKQSIGSLRRKYRKSRNGDNAQEFFLKNTCNLTELDNYKIITTKMLLTEKTL